MQKRIGNKCRREEKEKEKNENNAFNDAHHWSESHEENLPELE